MRKGIVAAAVGLACALALAVETQAPIPKEGKIASTKILSAQVQAVPLGTEHARLSYDGMGAELGEGTIFHNSSVRCLGALTLANGAFDDEAGVCIYTRPDGDKAFTSHRGAGKAGAETRGTWKFIGGTGKLAGIQGGGEWVRNLVRPALEGTSQSITKSTGTYKLPTTTAER